MAHVHPDGLDVVVRFVAPHLLEDQGRGHGLAVALQQAVQQFEFQVGEAHRLVKPDGFKALRHQGDAAVAEDFVVLGGEGGMVAAAQQRLNPHHQLLEIEGLGEIVVGAGIETAHLVFDAAEGREHQDRNLGRPLIAP